MLTHRIKPTCSRFFLYRYTVIALPTAVPAILLLPTDEWFRRVRLAPCQHGRCPCQHGYTRRIHRFGILRVRSTRRPSFLPPSGEAAWWMEQNYRYRFVSHKSCFTLLCADQNRMGNYQSGLEGGSQTGLVPGKWMLATEEGCWNVYVYQFDKEADARRAFESLHICRILYDPTGTEVDHHDGGNFLALGTIRKHTRDRTPPSHDLPRENGTAPAAAMAVGGAAGGAVGGAIAVPVTLGIVNSLGFTSAGIAAGSTAAAMMSAEAVAAGGAVASGGLVATLQAVGAAGLMAGGPAFVAATVLLPAVACAAVGVGIAAGISHFSRGAYSSGLEGGSQTGLVPGKWMLATEEGCWNVYVYQFDKEADARRAFESLHICRILYDPSGAEVAHHDGGNFMALGTVRRHTRDRTPI